jgi:hypothetical protein
VVANGKMTLTWDAVPGAMFYRVARVSSLEPGAKTVASGLTKATFTEPAPVRGESVAYTVFAVGRDGAGDASETVKLAPQRAIPRED